MGWPAKDTSIPGNAEVAAALRAAEGLATALGEERELARATSSPVEPEQHVYDLIVPAFNAPDFLARCLDSLLAGTDPRHAILVIDDASTDPRVPALLRQLARRHPRLRHHRLDVNAGFPGAVNTGLALTTRDVVLVNADTEFPPGWLARMDRCRRSDAAIHAVCPLSNNATICSVPQANDRNGLPRGLSITDMDRLVQQTSLRRYPRVPTVVGFCMLMTREAIDDVGPFDVAFGRGYGEEVDWCQRAWKRGYASAICDDVYVYHHGGVGFSQVPERAALQRANERLVSERWPQYLPSVQSFCMLNPLRYQQHRLFERLRRTEPSTTRVLHVTHAFEGLAGTELFTRQLVDGMRGDVCSTVLYPATLSPYRDGAAEEEGSGLLADALLKVRMSGRMSATPYSIRGVAASLRAPAVERFFADVAAATEPQVVQFSHFANLGSFALPMIARALGAKVVIVLHDYFLLCADWNLLHADGRPCGEAYADAARARCVDCIGGRAVAQAGYPQMNVGGFLATRSALARAIADVADAIVAPSRFVRDQFARAWGPAVGARIRILPHGTPAYPFDPVYRSGDALRVAFVGNATRFKGIDTFVEAANRLQGSAMRFGVLGGTPPGMRPHNTANLEWRGPYPPRELSRLLQDWDVAFIGPIAHETFCYTIDEAFRAGVPVVATAVGAIPERVDDGGTGLLVPPSDADALVAALRRLDADRSVLADMRRRVAALSLRSVADMVADYRALYAELAVPAQHDARPH